MNGIKYFKLLNPRYGDDSTKGCALTGAEVDGNFNFLRGYDIQSVDLVDDTILRIERVNADVITVDLQNDEIRRNVEVLNEKTAALENQTSEMSETLAEQGQMVSDHENRVGVLENDSQELSAKTEDHEQRIAELERQVENLNTTVNTLQTLLTEIATQFHELNFNEVTGDTFSKKVKNVTCDFIQGNPESVDFDVEPSYSDPTNPQHIHLRFGENARFVANTPNP